MHRKWHTSKCKRLVVSTCIIFTNCSDLLWKFHSFSILEMSDSEGRTPLHWAIDRGHLNVAEALVEKNADVNAKVNK